VCGVEPVDVLARMRVLVGPSPYTFPAGHNLTASTPKRHPRRAVLCTACNPAHLLNQPLLPLRHVPTQLVHAKHAGHRHARQEGRHTGAEQSRHRRRCCYKSVPAVAARASLPPLKLLGSWSGWLRCLRPWYRIKAQQLLDAACAGGKCCCWRLDGKRFPSKRAHNGPGLVCDEKLKFVEQHVSAAAIGLAPAVITCCAVRSRPKREAQIGRWTADQVHNLFLSSDDVSLDAGLSCSI
jgi:hypothetical protein